MTECRFPNDGQTMAYDDIIRPLDTIIQQSQNQLNGMDQITVSARMSETVTTTVLDQKA